MANINGGTIQFGVRYNVDTSGLNKIKNELQQIQKMDIKTFSMQSGQKGSIAELTESLNKVKNTAKQVEDAMQKAFNPTLGGYNVNVLNKELNNIGLNKIANDFNSVGVQGKAMFAQLTAQATSLNTQLRQSHKILDEFATTMANTIKWNITQSIMNTFTNSVAQSYEYIKNLDASLNDIRIVTGQSAEQMDRFAISANNAAQRLGASTLDYTQAALIYYQQGLSDAEVKARTDITLKTANVTQQSADTVSEQLTAVWNGYKVSAEEAELYIDKMAAVAVTTASDLQELSTGMQKVASAANVMGVDIDQLNAQLSTVVSVTRQAPEQVGTAFKTIYARMSTIASGGEDDDGATLTSYTKKMNEFGISVLDSTGSLRDMGKVIEEIGEKWNTLTREQQISLAQTAAGTRQYNNLLALFDNWDMYNEALETSQNAAGTLNEQNAIYLESMAAHIQQLQNANDDLMDSLFNADSFKGWIDAGTMGLGFLSNLVDAIGGGGNALLSLGSIATQVFSKNISQGINTALTNLTGFAANAKALTAQLDVIREFAIASGGSNQTVNTVIAMRQNENRFADIMTEEERLAYDERIKKFAETQGKADEASKSVENFKSKIEELLQILGKDKSIVDIFTDDEMVDAEKYAEKIQNIIDKIGELKEKTAVQLSTLSTKGTSVAGQTQKQATKEDLNQYSDIVKNSQAEIDSLRDIGKLYEENSQESKKYLVVVNKLSEAYKNLKEKISEASKNKKSENDPLGKKDIKAINDAVSQVNKAKTELENAMKEISDIANSGNIGEGLQLEFNKAKESAIQAADAARLEKEALDEIDKALAQREAVKNVIDTVGAIGQLSTAIISLQNLGSIWNNQDLSAGEKILQTFQSLGYTIPSVILAFKQLNSVYKSIQAQKKIKIALDNQELIFTKGQIASLGKLTFAQALSNDTEKSSNALKKISASLHISEAQAKELATQATNKQTIANNALNASLLANPIFWVIGGLTALIAIITTTTKAIEENRKAAAEARIETNNAIVEQAKSQKELADANKELYNTYKNLENQYLSHQISKEELLEQTNDIIEAYDIENGKLYALTGNYKALSEAIEEAREAELKESVYNQKESLQAQKDIVIDTAPSLSGYEQLGFGGAKYGEYFQHTKQGEIGNLNLTEFFRGIDSNILNQIDYKESLPYGGKIEYYFDVDESSYENIEKVYSAFENRLNEFKIKGIDINNEEFNFINDFLKNYKEQIEQVREQEELLLNTQTELFGEQNNLNAINNFNEFKEKVENIRQSLQGLGYDEKQINEALKKYISTLGTEYSTKFLAISKLDNIFDETRTDILNFIEELSNEDLSILVSLKLNGEETKEEIQNYLDIYSRDLSIGVSNIELLPSIRKKVISGKVDTKDLEDLREAGYKEELKDFEELGTLQQLDIIDKISNEITKSSFNSIQDFITGEVENNKKALEEEAKKIGNDINNNFYGMFWSKSDSWLKRSEEEDFNTDYLNQYKNSDGTLNKKAYNDRLKYLSEGYQNKTLNPEEITEYEQFFRGYEEELNSIIELQERYLTLAKNKQEAYNISGEEYYKDIETLEGISNALEIVNNQIENFSIIDINDAVFKNIEDSLDSVISKTELLNSVTSKIGKGFTMAAEDVVTFSSVYPELFEGMEAGEDGLMKLNQQAVKDFIQGEKYKLHTQAEAAKLQAQNQLDLISGEEEYLKIKIDNLKKLLIGETNTKTAQQNIDKAYLDFKNKTNGDSTESQIKNEEAVSEANTLTVNKFLENIDRQGKAVERFSQEYAAALAGKTVDWEGIEDLKNTNDGKSAFEKVLNELNEEELDMQADTVRFDEEYRSIVAGNEEAIAQKILDTEAELKNLEEQRNKANAQIISAEAMMARANSLDYNLGQGKGKSSSIQRTDYDPEKADVFAVIDGKIKKSKLEIETLQNEIQQAEESNDWERVHSLQGSLNEQLDILIKFYQEKRDLVQKDIEDNRKLIEDLGGDNNIINEDGTINDAIYKQIYERKNQEIAAAAAAYDNAKNQGASEEAIAAAKETYEEAKDDLKDFGDAVKNFIKDTTETLPSITKEISDLAKAEKLGDVDTFAEVDYQLNRINKDLSTLQKLQKGLSGQDLQKNLQEQIALLEKRNALLQDKKTVKQAELNAKALELTNAFGHEGFKINEDGTTTYRETLNSLVAKSENLWQQYEAANESSKAAAKESYDRAVEEINALIQKFAEYIALQESLDEIEDQLEENIQKQIDAQIKAFDAKIKFQLDMDDLNRQWMEFIHKIQKIKWDIWGNDILDEAKFNIEKLSTFPKSISTSLSGLNRVTEAIKTMKSGDVDSIFGDAKQGLEQAINLSKEYRERAMQDIESMGELIEQIEQAYLNMIDRASETLSGHIEQFELINDILEHNKKLTTMLTGENYASLDRYYKLQEKNNNAQIATLKQQTEMWKSRMDAAVFGSEEWVKLRDEYEQSLSSLNGAVENAAQNIIDEYQNAINLVFEEFEKKLTDGSTLSELGDEWERINTQAEMYYDSINGAYEIEKLRNKYIESIDSTKDIDAQERLTKLMQQQVSALKDKENLSKYDIDRANLLYEIELKKMALEDAKNNKSKMRLRRDSQGNYSYQYVADNDSIAQAQQEVSDLQNQLYNLDKDAYKQNLDQIYKYNQELNEKLKEIAQDNTLTEEEKLQKMEDLNRYYTDIINKIANDNIDIRKNLNQSAFDEMINLGIKTQEEIDGMTNAQINKLMSEVVPQWNQGIQAMTDKIAAEGGFGPIVQSVIDEIMIKHAQYQESLRSMADAAGIDLDNLTNGYDTLYMSIQQIIDQSGDMVSQMNEQMDAAEALAAQVAALKDEYLALVEAMKAATEANLSAQNMSMSDSSSSPSNTSPDVSSVINTAIDVTKAVGQRPSKKYLIQTALDNGGTGSVASGQMQLWKQYWGTQINGIKLSLTDTGRQNGLSAGEKVNIDKLIEYLGKGWIKIKEESLNSFDTGGYTGDWGKEGRLALLHQKELVLNSQDTENMLKIINQVRDITAKMGNLNINSLYGTSDLINNNTVDQNVRIEANFPNVTNSNEIQSALENLVNTASQYAFRNRR